jgi:hypothetical protein
MFAPRAASQMRKSAEPQRATAGPRRPTQDAIEQTRVLQGTVGNQAMLRLMTQRAIPTRAEPGGHEQEARRLSKLMVARPAGQLPTRDDSGLARGLRTSEAGGSAIQAVLASLRAPASVHRTLSGGGQPLGAEARAELEPRFGFDFAAVRLHADADAARSARDLNARAYTVGNHIVVDAGESAPDGPAGRRVLAHELTHVVQQSGGGAAVLPWPDATAARLPISPSGVTLQCDDKSDAAYERRIRELAADRPGAAWPYGPVTKHKSATHDLFDYYMWVRVVERAYGPDKQQVLQRLRRIYYSGYAGKGEYDSVIAHLEGTGGDTPLDARLIPLGVIDGLYETNVLRLPDGELIDVSHVLTALDTKTAGLTVKGGAAEGYYGINWLGVVTWAGDLASWFVNWIDKLPSGKKPDPSPAGSRAAVQKVDLISDMDGQILAAEKVRPATIETIKAEGRILEHSNVVNELSQPVSAILNDYFGIGMGTAQPPNLKNRFAAFVRVASPPIPHRNASGSGPITLTADTEEAIYDALRGTARLLIEKGNPDGSGEQVVTRHDAKLHSVARQFTQFLRTGLTAGDAPWPGI